MNGFRIRDARSGDQEAIGSLWEALMDHHRKLDPRFAIASDGPQKYRRFVQDLMRARNARVLVAMEEEHNGVIGFLIGELQSRPPMAPGGYYGFISDIYVQESWRQRGVGRALFEEMRRWFSARKATEIELFAAEANPSAIAFWQEMGLSPFLKMMRLEI